MAVTALTNGIKVSVETSYQGRYFSKSGPLYLFNYDIVIENTSERTVQLLGRHWFIYDTNDEPSEVEGEGVVGVQPILSPYQSHAYQSGCQLKASIGAMEGVYKMMDLETFELFTVKIPTFQFFATPRLN